MTTKIYVLIDPNTNEVRYVGKSNNPIKRFYKHCQPSKIKTHKNNWVNKLLNDGKKPILFVIDEVPIDEWVFWETYWISQMKAWGFDLTNSTLGGDGSTFGNQTSFKKGNKPHNTGVKMSESQKENLRQKNLGKKQNKETIEKRNKSLDGKRYDNGNSLIELGKKTRFNKGQTPWNKNNFGHKLGGLKKSRPVQQFSLDGKMIGEFCGCQEAASSANVSYETVRNSCNDVIKNPRKFIWKWKK